MVCGRCRKLPVHHLKARLVKMRFTEDGDGSTLMASLVLIINGDVVEECKQSGVLKLTLILVVTVLGSSCS